MKKILPPQLFYFALFVILVTDSFFPLVEFILYPFNLVGILIFAIGVLIAAQGKAQFKRIGTNILPFNEPDVLVTDGLFIYSRNPMYLGFVLALLGIAIFAGSISALLIAGFFAIIVDRWYINFEEKMLMNKFAEEYTMYKSNTRRWI